MNRVLLIGSKAIKRAERWRRVRNALADRTRHLGPVWRQPYQTTTPLARAPHFHASEYSLSSTDDNLSA